MTYALWTIQALLAVLFVLAGSMKLITPMEVLTAQVPLPGVFVRFVGAAEALGGLGLILPGLLRIRPGLVSLAALELLHVMIGAAVLTVAVGGDAVTAVVPLLVGLLLIAVAYGRWRLAPHTGQRLSAAGLADAWLPAAQS
ncbi:MAG: DoxX family protein [Chloroflexota bacterium]|nr:DoxX family protein [Chloroflexota bacterium]